MKTIIILINALFCVSFTFAQTYYYNTTKTFYENGYTYQCDVDGSKMVVLYNKNNTFAHVMQVYKSTGYAYLGDEKLQLIKDDTWTKPKCYSIVNNAFSPAEKQRVKGCYLSVGMYISAETGKVTEVDFHFISIHPYATIPVSVYRRIETELKQNIWFVPDVDAKKLNYLIISWTHEIK